MCILYFASWKSELSTLLVGLSGEHLPFFQQCKEEEMSDSEFIESRCDEENGAQTWYPSETTVEEWNQGKDMRNEHKDSLKEGHCLP